MKFTEKYLKRPYLIISLIMLAAFVGIIGFKKIPINLFPDSDYPQIAVVVPYPGASAKDIEDKVTRLIEKELNTLDGIRKVSSSTKDEITAITAEFEYSKGLEAAATDAANALKKIEGQLPQDIRPPQIFKISKATQPDLILSLTPKENSPYDLAKIRQLAENNIKEDILRIKEVANAEVFGGYNPELTVVVKPDLLNAYGINITQVITAITSQNLNIPNGLIIREKEQYILKTQGELNKKEDAERIVIARIGNGNVYLKDIADIIPGYQERQSLYHGNGKSAIGISILRSHEGKDMDTIHAFEKALPSLKAKYPMIDFEIADTQKDLIEKSVDNMIDALRDAIIMTVFVIFLFLADIRGMIIAAISIPFTYLLTFAVMYIMGMEFNMVTLTGIILAVGMLLDDAIVVIENIERRYHQKKEDLKSAVFGGTDEVMLAIFSGTYATIMVLIPIIFIGGFVQTILRPLSVTLTIALAASYIVSVTVIPLFAPLIMKAEAKKNRTERLTQLFDHYIISPIRDFFVGILNTALKHRALFLIGAAVVLVFSMKQMPLVGRDLMPPMDTGIIKVNFETDSNTSLAHVEEILNKMEDVIKKTHGVERISTTIGSEPGIISFGSGRIAQQGTITIHLVDRFHRKESIWQIEDKLRQEFRKMPGLKSVDVFDYGATAMSSIKASIDIMISGPDPKIIDTIGSDVMERLKKVRGLTSISRSWTYDKKEIAFKVDMQKAAIYSMSPVTISQQMATAVRGGISSVFRVPGQDGYFIRVQLSRESRNNLSSIESMLIQTPKGAVPIKELGTFELIKTQTAMSRQYLQPTLDIYGYRSTAAISHIHDDIDNALKDIKLPPGYSINHEGDLKQMKESFGRLIAALAIGLILLYFSLVPAFKSWIHPLTIMSAIPLALIGAVWSMLITGKHQCMPSFMGMILLAGIVVKNSILLIDFIEEARGKGEGVVDAIVGSVRIRTRPILMTAVGTSVGMLPIALEWAIGLERLSPLAVVAIGGLMVSTFLTLVYVPILYSLFDELKEKVKRYGAILTKLIHSRSTIHE
ncbi:AcrB/AcrD/AcrF family protein [hot springs metagenome]|uniref:AcrB/AcrD/AcrF family protein n=1 Tax=hot springs metagenome TaxID=433727 RepID=A0A5J4L4T8_9ZZZZ